MLSAKESIVITIMIFVGIPVYLIAFSEKSVTGLLIFVDIFALCIVCLFHTKKSISFIIVSLIAYCNFYYFLSSTMIVAQYGSIMKTMSIISASIAFVIIFVQGIISEENTSQKIIGAFIFLLSVIGLLGKLAK